MKRWISYFLFLSWLMVVTSVYAETQTLTTYYPAPSGNYNKIQANSVQLVASTLSAIQAQYRCSFDPSARLSPCPAGLMYYDTNAQTIYVSAGTHWRAVNSTCVPLVACSDVFNCSTDSCGFSCGTCSTAEGICSSTTAGTPGKCT